MKYHFDCPERKKVRLIVNTDAKNEADDQFAIVHALLSPKFDVKGLIAAQFGERHTTESMHVIACQISWYMPERQTEFGRFQWIAHCISYIKRADKQVPGCDRHSHNATEESGTAGY